MAKTFETLVEKKENGKRCMYLACHFNGRRLKDSSLLCYISILLKNTETRLMDIVKVKCSLELVFIHVF
jgi:Zn-finger protein